MRSLWPIEREVLEIAAVANAAFITSLRQQIETAKVISFKNTGAGFFSKLVVTSNAALLVKKSPLEAGYGDVSGIEHGMGFIVFLTDGYLSMIEGYCNGDVSTTEIDFSQVAYKLMP